jgi:hypothetical protein
LSLLILVYFTCVDQLALLYFGLRSAPGTPLTVAVFLIGLVVPAVKVTWIRTPIGFFFVHAGSVPILQVGPPHDIFGGVSEQLGTPLNEHDSTAYPALTNVAFEGSISVTLTL